MIKVTIGNTFKKAATVIVDGNTTIASAIESAGLVAAGSYTLDGTTIVGGGFNRTFNDYGVTDPDKIHFLINVAKADNAKQ